jgi:hypothetical protein
MKTFVKFNLSATILMAVIFSTIFSRCTNDDAKPKAGDVTFAYNSGGNSSGRVNATSVPSFVKYTVRNEDGDVISDKVAVFKFGAAYTSERQTFSAGHYVLEEYFVLNQENEIIYAAVLQGSPNAPLVNKTLPMVFDVASENTTYVAPDVLPVTNNSLPQDFGYVKWSFNISATLVKFILPVHSSLITNFKSATIKIVQGNYNHTQQFQGSPSTQVFADVLVKANTGLQFSIIVDADDVYSEGYKQIPQEDVLNRTSISQMEFTQTLSSIQSNEITIPQFKHKFGHGWSFKFAEITTYAVNGAWIKMRYANEDLSGRFVKLTTNASQFVYSDWMKTDKIIWSQPTMYVKDDGVISIYNVFNQIKGAGASFGQPVCENGICTLTADFNTYPKYDEFLSAYSLNEWKAFDAYTMVDFIHNGQTNHITSYFKIEEDVPNAWPARTTSIQPSSEDLGYIRN